MPYLFIVHFIWCVCVCVNSHIYTVSNYVSGSATDFSLCEAEMKKKKEKKEKRRYVSYMPWEDKAGLFRSKDCIVSGF